MIGAAGGLGAEHREDLERALQLGVSGEVHVLIDQACRCAKRRRSPSGGDERIRGQNHPGPYLRVDVEVMLNSPEFLGEITSTWACSSHPFPGR